MWLWILIALLIGFVSGIVVEFFVMKNNPKYFNPDDILKGKRDDILDKLKGKIKEKL